MSDGSRSISLTERDLQNKLFQCIIDNNNSTWPFFSRELRWPTSITAKNLRILKQNSIDINLILSLKIYCKKH